MLPIIVTMVIATIKMMLKLSGYFMQEQFSIHSKFPIMTFMLMDIISTVTCHRFIIYMAGAITSLFHGVNPIMKSGLFMLEFPVRRRDASDTIAVAVFEVILVQF